MSNLSSASLPPFLVLVWDRTVRMIYKLFAATEWVGKKEGNRPVRVIFDAPKKMILVQTDRGKPLRTIDLSMMSSRGMNSVEVGLSADNNLRMMVVKVPKEYDLV